MATSIARLGETREPGRQRVEIHLGLNDRAHAARLGRRRGLHQAATLAYQHDGPRHVEHAGGDQRRVLAEAVAAEHLGLDAELALERTEHRDLGGEDGRLRVLGLLEARVGLEAELGDVEAEGFGCRGEDFAGGGAVLVEVARHAGALRALARKRDGEPRAVPPPPLVTRSLRRFR